MQALLAPEGSVDAPTTRWPEWLSSRRASFEPQPEAQRTSGTPNPSAEAQPESLQEGPDRHTRTTW
eukprot:6518205-Heterocapsa_arctica.AAC.1